MYGRQPALLNRHYTGTIAVVPQYPPPRQGVIPITHTPPAVEDAIPIAYCLLPIVYCLLPIVYCLMSTWHCPSTSHKQSVHTHALSFKWWARKWVRDQPHTRRVKTCVRLFKYVAVVLQKEKAVQANAVITARRHH